MYPELSNGNHLMVGLIEMSSLIQKEKFREINHTYNVLLIRVNYSVNVKGTNSKA